MRALTAQPPHIGKRIGDACYLDKTAIAWMSASAQKAVQEAQRIAGVGPNAFNVVKLHGEPPKRVSLLAYQNFDSSPFPALLDSWTVHLKSARSSYRSYRFAHNPPILHRKELLLPPDDPRRETFAALTRELELRNLFHLPSFIGFRSHWEKRLADAGIAVCDHLIVDRASDSKQHPDHRFAIKRHRTAISRSSLSTPMQALARHGFLDGGYSVFDYGCGRGGDVFVLSAAGIHAKGWDPHYLAHAPLEVSDVVNLGYVLNVIENPEERVEVLRTAFGLARRLLAVAVMLVDKSHISPLQKFGDGILTSRDTFQKFFSQQEARALIEAATHQEAIAVGPGVFFVFRDQLAEQSFLERRGRRHGDISHLLAIAPPPSKQPESRDQSLLAEHREIVEAVWESALRLGRLPCLDELEDSTRQELTEWFGSVRKAAHLAQHIHNADALSRARQSRIDDLTVYFALNYFSRRKRYGELPIELQRDVKAFFGSHARAEESGKQLLYSVGDPAVILEAAQKAKSRGLGYLDGFHSLQLDVRLVPQLPAPLRAYVGCAAQLYGDVGEAHLVKIHLQSSKLTLLRYDGYDATPVPRLVERVKIRMRDQDVEFFTYGKDRPPQLLFMKSRYMAHDQPGYKRQKKFDDQLDSLNLFDFSRFGPSSEEFWACLRVASLAINGFRVLPIEARSPSGFNDGRLSGLHRPIL